MDVDLDKVKANADELVLRCRRRGVSVTVVTKATLGCPKCANAGGSAVAIGDSRVENIERMRAGGVDTPMVLIRTPALSQVEQVVATGAVSANSEPKVLRALAAAARSQGRVHGVIIMVELGDLREGVMPSELNAVVRGVLSLPHLELRGLGTNLACRNGVEPSVQNMRDLSAIVDDVEATFRIHLDVVSGGNSANLEWALGPGDLGRINNLRLGESVLLGTEPLRRQPIEGLHQDAFTMTAEVIESQRKPTKPWGRSAQNAFGQRVELEDRGDIWQTILAVGQQDTDPNDLWPQESVRILGASSDHLVVATDHQLSPGDQLTFVPGYSALLRAMTSPYVTKRMFRPSVLDKTG